MRIGIDIMGSDNSPTIHFEAILQAIEQLESTSSLLVLATKDTVKELSSTMPTAVKSANQGRIEFYEVESVIAMSDEPLSAIRHKKSSSLVTGIRLLKKRQIDAFISPGNTGALIASSTLSLPMLPNIQRPALLAILPSQKGTFVMLDVGGNVSCKAHHLIQFAYMGAAYQRSHGISLPKVGLLNIGVESKKGTSELRQAYQILQEKAIDEKSCIHFVGNVEGREIFKGGIDVLVTDGFTGNVLLKSTEGISSFILEYLTEKNKKHPSENLKLSLNGLQKHFSDTEYPGALLCGVDGLVMKCHGNSSAKTMLNTILAAIKLVRKNFLLQIKDELNRLNC